MMAGTSLLEHEPQRELVPKQQQAHPRAGLTKQLTITSSYSSLFQLKHDPHPLRMRVQWTQPCASERTE